MKRLLSFILASLVMLPLSAQPARNINADKAAIKSMCGCYSISFDYAETFSADSAYKVHAPYHAEASAEWVFVEEESDDKLVLQHLLIVGGGTIIKHWRQDWMYENTSFHQFNGDLSWKYSELPTARVAGQWTQLVTQVDDSPRYIGSATWVHVDGRHWWESTTDAPLPRREYSKRSDYNVMQRTNRHEIMDDGWLHGQDNLKIVRKPDSDEVLVREAGRNYYTKIDDQKCAAAQKWWKEHRDFWKIVRTEWEQIYAQKQHLYLHKKVDEQLMWEKMFELDMEYAQAAQDDPQQVRKEVHSAIESFLADAPVSNNAGY